MKSIGIVRKIDPMGRIVIPMEIRKIHQWEENAPIEIYVEGDRVILQKYTPTLLTDTELALENIHRVYGADIKIVDKLKELELLIKAKEGKE